MKGLSFKIFAAGLLLILVTAAVVYAADTTTTKPDVKNINLQVTSQPVIDVIDSLFGQAGHKYTIEAGVSGSITLSLKAVTFESALKSLSEAAGLTYTVTDGRYYDAPKVIPIVETVTTPVGTPSVIPSAAVTPATNVVTPIELTPLQPLVSAESQPPTSGPILYGSISPSYDEGLPYNSRFGYGDLGLLMPPSVIYIQSNIIQAPDLFTPPMFRTPSIQRFIDAIGANDSIMRPRFGY